MAVYAAHLTRTLQGAPSVFQVAAQEALGATVKPAFRKVFEYLAAVYPDSCGWCVRWYDELYLVLDCLLQYHYLKHYAASFSESFYGLVRAPVRPSGEFSAGPRLPRALELGSLAALALLPYARDRAERAVQRWRERDEDGTLGKGYSGRARRAAILVYSCVHMASWAACVVQLARYVRGAASPTPALAALGLALRPAPAPAHEDSWADLFRSIAGGNWQDASVSFPMLGRLLLRAAEHGAFAVQFLRWWESRAPAAHAKPCPHPPQRSAASARYDNKCPICLQPWKTPAALPVSGLVFCYSCISRQLRARAACPVTRLPAAEDALVRLYLD